MDWIPPLVKAIGFVRLILIFSGILMLSRCILKTRALSEYQKQCFAISGVIYLLGLTPQSLLLLISNSDAENYLLDSGYLCWIQKFACIVAVSIHALLFLRWMYTVIRQYYKLHNKSVNAFFEHKEIFHLLVIYVLLLVSSRVFFLNIDDSKKTYMDIASRTDNASLTGWTVLPVQNPAQVIRLQLLLCENSLSATDMKYFLIVCYVLLLVPLALLFFIFKPSFLDEHSTSEASVICHPDLVQGMLNYFFNLYFPFKYSPQNKRNHPS